MSRCESCLLPLNSCVCDARPEPVARSAFLLLMYEGEYYKPSNTGRLVADITRENFAFLWNRTQPDEALLALLAEPRYQPIIVFPHQYARPERCVSGIVDVAGRIPLFVMLDGTWREAKKMFSKSPYLDKFPVLGIEPEKLSAYALREAAHSYHLCTAEVAAEVLRLANDEEAASELYQYFEEFRTRYLSGKSQSKTVKKGSE